MPLPTQSYDPYALINDIEALLRDRGLSPQHVDLEQPGARLTAACVLLRSLDVAPLRGPESLDLDGHLGYHRRVHGD